MPGLQAPLGNLETIMASKESTYGTLNTANPVYHAFSTHGPKISTAPIDRMPRQSYAKPYPGTGGRSVAMSLDVETDEDTFNQWLFFALCAQTAPTQTLFTTTLAGNIASNATTCQLTSMAPTTTPGSLVASALFVGSSLVIDSGGSHPETVTVTGVTAIDTITFTPATAYSHTSGATCKVTAANNGRATLFTMGGDPMPSFSMQVYRSGGVSGSSTDYLGSCVDQLTISAAQGQAIKAKLSLKAQQGLPDASPLTPSMSVLNPFLFPQQSTAAQIGGEVPSYLTAATLTAWQFSINRNLKPNWGYGAGNTVRNFQEGLAAVQGSMTLLFESVAQQSNFNAALSGGNLPPITMLIPVVGTDAADGNSPYGFTIWCPNVFLSDFALADDTSKPCEQTATFRCGETLPGYNDAIAITYISKKTGLF